MREPVVIVDGDPGIRRLLVARLEPLGHPCRSAASAAQAIALAAEPPRAALVLSDVAMPDLSGVELLQRLKALDETLQVVMVSGRQDLETVRRCLREGAYDYLLKPFDGDDLTATVSRAVERCRLVRQNEHYRQNLERLVLERTEEIRQTRDIALITLARLAESRDSETGHHLERIAAFSRRLAEALAAVDGAPAISQAFVEQLARSSPLHDIGKVGIPDAILLKPGPLDAEEMAIMRTHTQIGGDTLRSVVEQFDGHTFLSMGMEIAYAHHERWDGGGYPRGLAGESIPLAARIVALADVYDCITSRRPYKPALEHAEAVRRISIEKGAHFDPRLVDAFLGCHRELAAIRARFGDAPDTGPPEATPGDGGSASR